MRARAASEDFRASEDMLKAVGGDASAYELLERRGEIGDIEIAWKEATVPGAEAPPPILYLHGNPVGSWIWGPFLERTGGIAPDLPGFGQSAKPDDFDYSLPGYADFLERLVDDRRLERFSLVVHDVGAITGLVLAQRLPDRLDRLVVANHAPLLPGYRWHRFARIWRTRRLGEVFMATTTAPFFKRSLLQSNVRRLPDGFLVRAWVDFDRDTRRAVLRLYRSMPEEVLVRHGRDLGRIRCPALVIWSTDDPYIGPDFGPGYADALGGDVEVEVYDHAGHWLWLDRPEVTDRVTEFLVAGR